MKWWAYIHSTDRAIYLKRWFPVPGGMCDLEYAKQEKRDGNDNIFAIVPEPFDADSKTEALKKALEIFESMGYNLP